MKKVWCRNAATPCPYYCGNGALQNKPRVDPVDPDPDDPDPDPVPVTISNDEPSNNFAAAWQGSAVWAMHPNPVWVMLPINAPSSDRH